MNLRQLKYFVAVAEEGNFTLASKKLHISQPPLSKQIQELESELELKLFKRLPNGVSLTYAGENLLPKARQLLAFKTDIENNIKSLGKGETGILTLGVVSSAHGIFPAHLLRQFVRDYPNLHINIAEGDTDSLLYQVHKQLIDIAILRTPFSRHHLICRPLKKESMMVIIPNNFAPFENASVINLKDLQQYPLIIHHCLDSLVANATYYENINLHIACHCDDVRTAIDLAVDQMGAALVPESAVNVQDGSPVQIKRVDYEEWQTQLNLVHLAHIDPSPLVKRFIHVFERNFLSRTEPNP